MSTSSSKIQSCCGIHSKSPLSIQWDLALIWSKILQWPTQRRPLSASVDECPKTAMSLSLEERSGMDIYSRTEIAYLWNNLLYETGAHTHTHIARHYEQERIPTGVLRPIMSSSNKMFFRQPLQLEQWHYFVWSVPMHKRRTCQVVKHPRTRPTCRIKMLCVMVKAKTKKKKVTWWNTSSLEIESKQQDKTVRYAEKLRYWPWFIQLGCMRAFVFPISAEKTEWSVFKIYKADGMGSICQYGSQMPRKCTWTNNTNRTYKFGLRLDTKMPSHCIQKVIQNQTNTR